MEKFLEANRNGEEKFSLCKLTKKKEGKIDRKTGKLFLVFHQKFVIDAFLFCFK